MKSFLKLIPFFLFFIFLFSCRAKTNNPKIAIAQYIDHPMLDECRKGFMDKMDELGYKQDVNVSFDYLNAQGDMNVNKSIADKFGKGKYDIIFSIATPITQALKKTTELSKTPVVFGAITDPVSAGLVNSITSSGNNFTGTSDKWPYYDQLNLIKKIIPKAINIGVVYNSGESNTEFAISETKKAANKLNLNIIESPITNTNEVALGTKNLIGKVDAVYITADNTTMASAPVIIKIATENNIPVFAGDLGTFESGCIAGIGVSYYNLGVSNAIMVDKILKKKINPSDIPIVISENPELMVNLKIARALNITIPDSIINNAVVIAK